MKIISLFKLIGKLIIYLLCSLMKIISPFRLITKDIVDFFIWFVFTILVGQLGIFINLIIRCIGDKKPIGYSLLLDSLTGSFYIFSIATVASMLGPLFANFINGDPFKFRKLKIVTVILSIFFVFFSGIIYSILQSKQNVNIAIDNISVDKWQLRIYFVSLIICIYIYCLLKIDNHASEYSDLEDQKVEHITQESRNISEDGNGIGL